jgi:iron-regulated transporter 1
MVPELQNQKQATSNSPSCILGESHTPQTEIWGLCRDLIHRAVQDFAAYFRHRVFLPSFAGALLYLTVLSFSGQMITWLLSAGYDSTAIATTRTLSVGFEILATWVAPWLMGRIGTTRAGLWLACWQIACLVGGMSVFWRFPENPFISASGLVGGTILSRIGLRGFDLCTQILVQEVRDHYHSTASLFIYKFAFQFADFIHNSLGCELEHARLIFLYRSSMAEYL